DAVFGALLAGGVDAPQAAADTAMARVQSSFRARITKVSFRNGIWAGVDRVRARGRPGLRDFERRDRRRAWASEAVDLDGVHDRLRRIHRALERRFRAHDGEAQPLHARRRRHVEYVEPDPLARRLAFAVAAADVEP